MKTPLTYRTQSAWRNTATIAAIALLSTLLLCKGIEGLRDFASVEASFQRQRIFGNWAPVLAKINTVLQLTAGALLLAGVFHRKIRGYGLGLTTAILAGYTIYTQLVLLNTFGSICACIGWFAGMTWTGIFTMNTLLLVLVLTVLFITLKERRPP